MVVPTASWLKLWRNSLDHLGSKRRGWSGCSATMTNIAFRLRLCSNPNRFASWFSWKARKSSSTTTEIEAVSRLEALPLLMDLTHHSYVLEAPASGRKTSATAGGCCRRPQLIASSVPGDWSTWSRR